MEKILEQTLLYDFYGELLTQHQREVYEDFVNNDLSLGEIAQEQGISRQGVHDIIKRCDKILQEYENKLHLMNKFDETKKGIQEIISLTELAVNEEDSLLKNKLSSIRKISTDLMKAL